MRWNCGQVNADSKESLAAMGIYPYPTIEEVEDCKFPKEWVSVKPLSSEDVNDTFSNIDDLEWLKPIAREKKVFLFGESHYYKNIWNLKNRILFALNTFDSYPLLVVEFPFSCSGFWDYYIGLADDKEAEKFFQDVLYDSVNIEEMREILEHLRRWNCLHPDKRIHIAGYDIEHGYIGALSSVIVPYFQILEPSFNINLENFTLLDLGDLLPDLQKLLRRAKRKNLIGEYPFITPQYVECVIENLKSRFWSHYDFSYYRSWAMVRNLTDHRFLGKFLQEGKAMIHTGSYHTPTHLPLPRGGNFLREGSYLSFDFPPTKGKTFSLRIDALAYQIGPMADVDSRDYLSYGEQYHNILNKFQKAYKQGLVSRDDYYLFDRQINDFDKLLLLSAYDYEHRPLLVEKVEWDKIINKSRETSPELYNTLRWIKKDYERYDAYIYVPRSPIVQLRKKRK
jgi:hypothetical protein